MFQDVNVELLSCDVDVPPPSAPVRPKQLHVSSDLWWWAAGQPSSVFEAPARCYLHPGRTWTHDGGAGYWTRPFVLLRQEVGTQIRCLDVQHVPLSG